MAEDRALEKTNRVNMLLDFYEPLLTEKQRTFLKHYFYEDFSLGEIAEIFQITRQAVSDHIKRAEIALEEYEEKLKLLAKHEERLRCLREMERLLSEAERPDRGRLIELVCTLATID